SWLAHHSCPVFVPAPNAHDLACLRYSILLLIEPCRRKKKTRSLVRFFNHGNAEAHPEADRRTLQRQSRLLQGPASLPDYSVVGQRSCSRRRNGCDHPLPTPWKRRVL